MFLWRSVRIIFTIFFALRTMSFFQHQRTNSVVRLRAQHLLQLFMNRSKSLQTSFSWSVVVHLTFGFSSDNVLLLFWLFELSHFLASEICSIM